MLRYWLILAILTVSLFGSRTAYASEGESDHAIQLTWGTFDPLQTDPQFADEWQTDGRAVASVSYWLVQFERPLTAADRDALTGLNVELIAYVPQLTYIVHADVMATDTLKTFDWVRWVGEYAPAYRVEPTLVDVYQTAQETRQATTATLIVTLFPQADVELVSAEIAATGAEILGNITDAWQTTFQLQADLQLLPQLAAIDGVNWIDTFTEAESQNMVATDITNVDVVRDTTFGLGLFGTGQTVAVADTGLDLGSTDPSQLHDDFENGNGSTRVLALYDKAYDGSEDHSGHGTHVAGTILGNGARSGSDPLNNDFANSQAGVAPQANLIFQAIGGDSGGLTGIPWYLAWMFNEAATPVNGQEAKIHSNSWGIPNSNGLYSSYSVAVDQYMWNNPEFLIVFAAGNEGHNGASSIMAPATAKNALSVGASDSSVDSPNNLSNYSGRGPTRDGRIKPDLVAPGTVITSTASAQRYDTDYTYYFGTSMATPHVAGAAALVREHLANEGHNTPSAALVKAMLINGTYDMALDETSNINVTRPTNEAGWGRLDVASSVGRTSGQAVQYWDSLAADVNNQSVALGTGDVATHTVTNHTSGEALHITLAWTDYPGTTAANGALINDLDLHVVAPDGTIFYPNHANSGTVGDNYDHVNNVVGIDIDTPQLGDYQIVVRGYNVAMATQPYALVVSGGLTQDDNVCEQAIDGSGIYNFCEIGVALEINDATGINSIRVEQIESLPTTLIDPAQMLNRYYRITVGADTPDAVLNVNAIFNYDPDLSRTALLESSLSAHQFDGTAWQIHAPDALDTANNTITVAALTLSGTSDWGFASSTPTAVTLSSQSASPFANDLTDSLAASDFAQNLTETLSAYSFANNLTNILSAFSFANYLTIFLAAAWGMMLVATAVVAKRALVQA